ncbi:MAG TPA: nuclear transport factor 2 family protein [Terriglobia bacterium]|nr:nuclear transport factor 2 family protein [Terriglobia bacterium]
MKPLRLAACIGQACLLVVLMAPPSTADLPASDEAQIRAVLDAQVAAWNRGDVDVFMQGYWKSEKTEFVGANGVFRGWQAVLERYRKAYPDRQAMGHLTFSDLEVTMLGPTAALVLGHWELDREHDHPGGVFTLIFRRFPEGWRIIHDHTSAVAGPASTQ